MAPLLGKRGRNLEDLLLYSFFLTIWKERNRRAFENIDKAKRAIKQCLCLIFGMVEGVYRRLHFVHVGLY